MAYGSYAYKMSSIVQLVRDEIEEPTARIFKDADINHFIDMGAVMCSVLTLCNEAEDVASLNIGDAIGSFGPGWLDFTTATDFIRIEGVSVIDDDITGDPEIGLQKIRPQAYGHVVANTWGPPKYYFLTGSGSVKQISLSPGPSGGAEVTDDLKFRGYKRVADFDAQAVGPVTLPDALQFMPFYYAMACVYARLGKHSLSALNMKMFINECNMWKAGVHSETPRVDSHDMSRIPDVTVTRI